MADGYAQQGGRLAVVNLHVQPGLANAMSGILNATRARVPILVTVGQQVTDLKDRAPFLGGELVAMVAPVAKTAAEVTRAAELPAVIDRAIDDATTGPRGPVVVCLPMDVLVAETAPPPYGETRSVAHLIAIGALRHAAEVLAAANGPVILAGDGVVHEQVGPIVTALAERLGAPIHGEPFAARSPVPAGHALWRGPLPGFAAEVRERLDAHDAVLAIGMPVFRLFGHSPGVALPAAARLVHLDVDAAEIGRNHRPDVGIAAPLADSLPHLLAAVADPVSVSAVGRRHDLERRIAQERDDARRALIARSEGTQITPAAFCRAIAAAVDPDDLVIDEALTSGRWLRTALGERNTPENWLAHRGSALGWGLPAAVGAKLADPRRRVMCVHGDGSFLFGVHALWTAARERLGVAVVVADNAGYEILRAGLEGLTGRAEGNWPGLALTDPRLDLVAISRGFGASAERVTECDRLPAALEDLWRRADAGPAVLVVPVTGRTPAVGYPLGER
jgi:benzoylformate decarboxylase